MNNNEHALIKLHNINTELRTALAKRADEIASLQKRLTKVEQARFALGLDQSPNRHTSS